MISTQNSDVQVPDGDWLAPTPLSARGGFATVRIPGSKSLTNRYLILAALAHSPSVIHTPLHSRDSALMIEALRALGVRIEEIETDSPFGPDLRVFPLPRETEPFHASVDCGLAGTVMRFVPPVAALVPGTFSFDGDSHARQRPLQPVTQALRDLGVDIDSQQNSLPFEMKSRGSIEVSEITIDASGSSQFLSALLLSAPAFEQGLTIHHRGSAIPSMPHVEMTLEVLREVGVNVQVEENRWVIPSTSYAGFEVTVEPDLSNAGPFLAAATVLGAEILIPDWPAHTTQGGDHWKTILPLFGAKVEHDSTGLKVRGSTQAEKFHQSGVDLNLAESGELAPTVAALCALTRSPSVLSGIAHLRGHETDRLAALVEEINRLGGHAQETEDGVSIEHPVTHGELFHTYDDHRMATAATIIGLAVPGIVVENIGTVAKTLPDFPLMWENMINQWTESARDHA